MNKFYERQKNIYEKNYEQNNLITNFMNNKKFMNIFYEQLNVEAGNNKKVNLLVKRDN